MFDKYIIYLDNYDYVLKYSKLTYQKKYIVDKKIKHFNSKYISYFMRFVIYDLVNCIN